MYLRKITPSPISVAEKELLAEGIRRLAGLKYFMIDIDDKSLVVYLPDSDPSMAPLFLELVAGRGSAGVSRMEEWSAAHVRYSKTMRFTLVNEDQRLYAAERWCFLGAIDDWIRLMCRPAPLDMLIEAYAPHLGQESFFELM